MSSLVLNPLGHLEKAVEELQAGIQRRSLRRIKSGIDKLKVSSDWLKSLLSEEDRKATFEDFDRHLHFVEYYLEKKDFEWIKSNFDDIKNQDLQTIRSKIHVRRENKEKTGLLSKNIFIVHGSDLRPMEELKTILRVGSKSHSSP